MTTCTKCGSTNTESRGSDTRYLKKLMYCNQCCQTFALDLETISVTLPMQICVERIQDMLICAFEGGSNYWYQGLHVVEDNGVEGEPGVHRYHLLATTPGGKVAFNADDEPGKILTLDLETCKAGLVTMAHKYPAHFADFMLENDDADTGDVFLQCCVFGELVYG